MDNSSGDMRTKSFTGNGKLFCEANPDRLSLLIGPDDAVDISLSTDPAAVWPNGMIIAAKARPVTINREMHGGIVGLKLFVSVSAGTAVVTFFEALDAHSPQRQDQ